MLHKTWIGTLYLFICDTLQWHGASLYMLFVKMLSVFFHSPASISSENSPRRSAKWNANTGRSSDESDAGSGQRGRGKRGRPRRSTAALPTAALPTAALPPADLPPADRPPADRRPFEQLPHLPNKNKIWKNRYFKYLSFILFRFDWNKSNKTCHLSSFPFVTNHRMLKQLFKLVICSNKKVLL